MSRDVTTATIRRRLSEEIGRIDKHAPWRIALAYPSPYRVGMSSLGYLQIYKKIQEEPGMACERAFLPDDYVRVAEGKIEEQIAVQSFHMLAGPQGDQVEVTFAMRPEKAKALANRDAILVKAIRVGKD
jgi:hypothetical protein